MLQIFVFSLGPHQEVVWGLDLKFTEERLEVMDIKKSGVWLYQVVYTWTCFEYDTSGQRLARKYIQHFMWNPLSILADGNQ